MDIWYFGTNGIEGSMLCKSGFMKGAFMNHDNPFTSIWMFIGMLLGLAIGCVIGIFQGGLGASMCFGLVFGMIAGIGVGIIIKKLKDKK